MKNIFYIVTFLLFTQLSSGAWASQKVLVISNQAHKEQVSIDNLREIYLGTRTMILDWKVMPLDRADSSPIRNAFYQLVVGKSSLDMKVYRAEQIFSGKGTAPQVIEPDQIVVQQVLINADAVGYVNDSADTSKVNVLLRLDGP